MTLAYDQTGNQTTDQFGKTTVWDAWGRTVLHTNGGSVNLVYEYDGLGRRIEEGGSQNYYTAGWQLIEIHDSGVLREELVWSPVYVDALLMRDRDTDADGIVDERIHALHDANFNITAITDDSGDVLGRFVYDPYGARWTLTSSFGVISGDYDQDGDVDTGDYQMYVAQFGGALTPGTGADGGGNGTVSLADYTVWRDNLGSAVVIDFEHGFAGGRMDTITGRLHFRHRDYDPQQMRWNERDPIGFAAGDLNLFRYVGNLPTVFADPLGLEPTYGNGLIGPPAWPGYAPDPVIQFHAQTFIPWKWATLYPGWYAAGNDHGPMSAPFGGSLKIGNSVCIDTSATGSSAMLPPTSRPSTFSRTEFRHFLWGEWSDVGTGWHYESAFGFGPVDWVRLRNSGRLPVPLAPAIDYNWFIAIAEEGDYFRCEISGRHDGFPAYQLFVNNQSVYLHNPVQTRENQLSLFGTGEHHPRIWIWIDRHTGQVLPSPPLRSLGPPIDLR